jgi:hypothetical protein
MKLFEIKLRYKIRKDRYGPDHVATFTVCAETIYEAIRKKKLIKPVILGRSYCKKPILESVNSKGDLD